MVRKGAWASFAQPEPLLLVRHRSLARHCKLSPFLGTDFLPLSRCALLRGAKRKKKLSPAETCFTFQAAIQFYGRRRRRIPKPKLHYQFWPLRNGFSVLWGSAREIVISPRSDARKWEFSPGFGFCFSGARGEQEVRVFSFLTPSPFPSRRGCLRFELSQRVQIWV